MGLEKSTRRRPWRAEPVKLARDAGLVGGLEHPGAELSVEREDPMIFDPPAYFLIF
jgi:hypothetical protein